MRTKSRLLVPLDRVPSKGHIRGMSNQGYRSQSTSSAALIPSLVVTMSSLDGSTTLTATATHYKLADEDHAKPWIESWSVEDADGDEPEYRSDEEQAQGELLDAALTERLAELAAEAVDEAVNAVESAATDAASWEGWEWAHDPGGHGIVLDGPGAVADWTAWETTRRATLTVAALDDADNMSEEAVSDELDCVVAREREYGERCQDAADGAREYGTKCVEAARAGEYANALDYAEQASAVEREYGDDPSYARLVKACRALMEHVGEDA